MSPPFRNLIPYFFGRDPDDEEEPEDPAKFIETSKAAFLSRFKNLPCENTDPNRFFNLLYNLKQRGRNIAEYIEEGDQLSSQCPQEFRDSNGFPFIAELDEGRKISLAQLYLRDKNNVSYAEAKDAVIKAHQRFAQPDTFNTSHDCRPSIQPTPSTQSDIVASSQGLRGLRGLRSPQPGDSTLYLPLITDANSQNHPRSIYCYHCWEEGHYYTSCTKPVVGSAQRETSKLAINDSQEVPRQLPQSLNRAHELPPKPQSGASISLASICGICAFASFKG